MGDILSFLKEIDNIGVGNSIRLIFLAFAFVMGVWKIVEWTLDKLNLYHNKLSAKETLETDIEALKASDVKQTQNIEDLKTGLKEIKDLLETFKQNERQATVAQIRPQLLHLYYKCTEQGYVTQAELETFDDLSQIYLSNKGNASFKHKIIPEFMKLPIKND